MNEERALEFQGAPISGFQQETKDLVRAMSDRCPVFRPIVLMLACSPAMAELTPIANDELSDVTGQSGITIEMSSHMTLSKFEYEDSGRFQVNNVAAGGAGVTTSGAAEGFGQYFDQLAITLDVPASGVLEVSMTALSPSAIGEPDTIDWGISTGAIDLVSSTGHSARFASGLEAWGKILSADYRVSPSLDAAGYDSRQALMVFTIEDLDLLADSGGLSVSNLKLLGTESSGIQMGSDDLRSFFSETAGLSSDATDKSVSGAENGFAVMSSSVGTEPVVVDGVSRELRTVRIDALAADVSVGDIAISGTSLGSAHLDNLRVSDTVIRFNNY